MISKKQPLQHYLGEDMIIEFDHHIIRKMLMTSQSVQDNRMSATGIAFYTVACTSSETIRTFMQ